MVPHPYLSIMLHNIKICQEQAAAHYVVMNQSRNSGHNSRCIIHQEHQMFWASKARQVLYKLLEYQKENQ